MKFSHKLLIPPIAERVQCELSSGKDVVDVVFDSFCHDDIDVFRFIVENVSSRDPRFLFLIEFLFAARWNPSFNNRDNYIKMIILRNELGVNSGFVHDLRNFLAYVRDPHHSDAVSINPYPKEIDSPQLKYLIDFAEMKDISMPDVLASVVYTYNLVYTDALDLLRSLGVSFCIS